MARHASAASEARVGCRDGMAPAYRYRGGPFCSPIVRVIRPFDISDLFAIPFQTHERSQPRTRPARHAKGATSWIPYSIALFIHIVGALGLSAAIGLEWLVVTRLPGVTTHDEALGWMSVMSLVRWIGPGSLILILLPGLYMAATRWGFERWPGAALIGFALLLVLGGLMTGRTMLGLGRAIAGEEAELSAAFRRRLQSPTQRRGLSTRTGLALGIVALMVFKPDLLPGVVLLGLSMVLGLAASFSAGRRRRSQMMVIAR